MREPDGMATLFLHRERLSWGDRFRAYGVNIDGEKVGSVRNGETAQFRLPPGNHSVELRIDWTGSELLTFDVGPGDQVYVNVSRNPLGMYTRHGYLTLADLRIR